MTTKSSATETSSLLSPKREEDTSSKPHHAPRRFPKVSSVQDVVQKRPSTTLAVVFTILLGVTNNVLLKIMYSAFGDRYAYAASQVINLLYIVLGGIPLLVFMYCTNQISQEERNISKRKFLYMGALDSLGTFLTAFGAIGTPGQLQPALNQTLLPMTMVVSYFYLRKRFAKVQVYGAFIITLGVTVSVVPSIASADFKVDALRWNSVAVYLLSNLPMAFSTCYKEYSFKRAVIHVLYLTQWVSIWQFLLGFGFFPLVRVPGLSAVAYDSFGDAMIDFWDGIACYLERIPACRADHTFSLLTGYTIVNFAFNFCGLFLTKHGSAVLNTIAFTAIIPLNTIVFAAPFLGRFREDISLMSVLGTCGVILGVFLYQSNTQTARVELRKLSLEELDTFEIETTQSAFQERIIGIDAVAGAIQAQAWVESLPRVDDTIAVEYDTLSQQEQ